MRWSGLCIAMAVVTFAPAALAAPAVAIVESIDSPNAGVEPLDYLEAGRIIALLPGQTMVVGYFKSCLRETITGGRVSVGTEMSSVEDGRAERVKLPCGEGKSDHTQAAKAGMVFRDGRRGKTATQTVHGTSPLVDLGGPGTLTIERLDHRGYRAAFAVRPGDIQHGRFFDLAKSGATLEPGGVYRFSFGHRQVGVVVDSSALSGAAPVLTRLVRLGEAD